VAGNAALTVDAAEMLAVAVEADPALQRRRWTIM